MESKLFEDRIKRKRTEENLESNVKKMRFMEEVQMKDKLQQKSTEEGHLKKIENERERRVKAEKEYEIVKKKLKESEAALTKLRLKQFKLSNREEKKNLNDSDMEFENMSSLVEQKTKSPAINSLAPPALLSSEPLPPSTLPGPVPGPQGPPGPQIPASLREVLHSASQTVAISNIMQEYNEGENNDEPEYDLEDDMNKNDVHEENEGAEEDKEDDKNIESIYEEKDGEDNSDKDPVSRPKEVKRKRPKNLTKMKPSALKGPYVLDEVKLKEDYKDSPEHIEAIKNFPRLDYEVFNPVENKIPASKNHKFLHLLFNSNDAEDTLATFQLTRKGFEEKYKTKFEEVETNPTHGATGGRGKDTLKSGVLKIKSDVWVNSFNTIFNMLMEFVQDKQEFRFFNWFIATAAEIDLLLGFFFLWMAPQEGGNSLGGTRYTTRTLKQIKTKVQNMMKHFLKRPDIDINSPSFAFTQNMYSMKRNKTAEEPMEGLQGDRERKTFEEEDKVNLDMWRTQPLEQV